MATLREVLLEWDEEPVLLDDGVFHWRPELLIDALEEQMRDEAERPEDERTKTHPLDEEVYSCAEYIARLSEQGYQILPGVYSIIHIGEEPYRVQHEPTKGYRLIFMENEEQNNWRYIHGQNRFEQKQSAYRRKSQLNDDWQKLRLLGA